MGSNESKEDEKPEYMVTLDPFWIDENEITNVQYGKCISENTCQPPRKTNQLDDPIYDHYPIVSVSWNEALNYCHWAGRRLPREAEWEKAARGTDGRSYPWGNQAPTGDPDNIADRNQCLDWADKNSDDGFEKSSPTGNYPAGASPYEALDMAGNVWEWVNDWYDPGYYVSVPVQNPAGPLSGERRVARGGSWYNQSYQVSVFMRDGLKPDYVNDDLGFRCAQNP
jgi:formylglycine-generating enzyme required for sulfatase activity